VALDLNLPIEISFNFLGFFIYLSHFPTRLNVAQPVWAPKSRQNQRNFCFLFAFYLLFIELRFERWLA